MKDKPKYWSIKRTLTLAEAAVLLVGEDPDKWPVSKLIHDRPYGFTPIFDTMIEDAQNIEGDGTAIEERDDGDFHTEYTLMTYESLCLAKRTEREWLSTKSDTTEIVRWAKALRDRLSSPVKLDFSLLVDISSTEVEASEKESLITLSNLSDKDGATYPSELDLAIQAWQAISTSEGKGKPKARIKEWLDNNSDLKNEAKERIAIVCNWDKLGGATRSD